MKKIGIIGTGIMGHGMAVNFLKAGHELVVWNREPTKTDDLVKAGGQKLDSPKAVAEQADIIFEVVSDDQASRSVWLGDNGILVGTNKDKILITSASLSLDWIEELANLCKEKGVEFFDMPLTGGRAGAESGALVLLVGGNKQVLDSFTDELAAISKKVYHFGPNGSGMRFKLLLNTMSAIHINAAAQAVALAQKAGIAQEDFYHALFDSNMGPASPATQMLVRDKDIEHTNFAVKWIEKDLRYAQAMAQKYGVEFDLLNDTQADYERVKSEGMGDQDWTKITKIYNQGNK